MKNIAPSRFNHSLEVNHAGRKLTCLFHTLTGALTVVPTQVWQTITAGRPQPLDTDLLDTLLTQGFLVTTDLDESALFRHWMQQYVHDFSIMRSKMLVTRRCNLRCRYCIIEPEAGVMSPATARVIDAYYIDQIARRRPGRVCDDYLGGEPLLNPRVVLESAERRHHFCRGLGADYEFSFTTNGTLLEAGLIDKLKPLGLARIRVSMAGPAAVHDRLRCFEDRSPTYCRSMANLETLGDLVPVLIECQYDAGSDDYLRIGEMLDDLARRGIPVENVAFTPILERRRDNRYTCGIGDPKKYLFLVNEALKRGYPQLDEPPQSGCMADLRSVLVFDTDGTIIPCPSIQGGEMAYGHASAGVSFMAESQLIHRHLPDKCLACVLVPICQGGCRLQALTHGRKFNAVDCNYDTVRMCLETYMRHQAIAALATEPMTRIGKAA